MITRSSHTDQLRTAVRRPHSRLPLGERTDRSAGGPQGGQHQPEQEPGREAEGILVVDQADRHDRFVQGVKSAFASNQTQLRRLIGDEASDTVLAKGVSQVVVYNVRRLASAIGARRVNRDSRCLYSNTMTPMIDVSAFGGSTTAQDVTGLANMWFEHRLVVGGNTVDSDAIILAIDRTTGEANEVLFY